MGITYHCPYAKEVPGIQRFLCAKKMQEGKDYSANLGDAILAMCPNQDFCECKRKPELLYSARSCPLATKEGESPGEGIQNAPIETDNPTNTKRKKKGK